MVARVKGSSLPMAFGSAPPLRHANLLQVSVSQPLSFYRGERITNAASAPWLAVDVTHRGTGKSIVGQN